ncbi:hypothetical protein Cylst_1829 [Cylindrospermum stagnale PCC 7417]|uniref:Uncharacterized protein n=1 Tax=Cylindrospermum stagnale PCC 7417 TaxID=56107 RepID=K9WX75_9NOST|nr:hypothetical protein [Cylindrospermum stagnale]AFZ24087.1 hypothetical protein Cylst_1829 [Cylindrospermum stagnale PCC 7417]
MSNSIKLQQIIQSMEKNYQQVITYILAAVSRLFTSSDDSITGARIHVFIYVPVNK